MGAPVKPRRNVSSDPTAGQMATGEIAAHQDTGDLFYKKTDGSVKTVGGAEINDAATNATETWSSTKIAAEVATATASQNTTPAPQLSTEVVDGNEGTTVDVTILNYNGVDNVYTVSSDDEVYVTVSRSTNTITITLEDIDNAEAVGTGTRTANVLVTAFDSSNYTYAGETTIAVTSNRLEITDAAIQVTDFSAAIDSSTNITIESLKPVADADGAELTSIVIAQEGGEGAWVKATPTLDIAGKNFLDSVSYDPANHRVYTENATMLAASNLQFHTDVGDAQRAVSSAVAVVDPVTANQSGSYTSVAVPTWWTDLATEMSATASNMGPRGLHQTFDGRHIFVCMDGTSLGDNALFILRLDTPHDFDGGATVVSKIRATELPTTFEAGQTNPNTSLVSYGGQVSMNDEGTKIFLRPRFVGSSTAVMIGEYELATPFDLEGVVTGKYCLTNHLHHSSYDGNEYYSRPCFTPDGMWMYFGLGNLRYDYGYTHRYQLAAPWSLDGYVRTQAWVSSSYVMTTHQISADGKRLLVRNQADDQAISFYDAYVYDIEGHTGTLSGPQQIFDRVNNSGAYFVYNWYTGKTYNFSYSHDAVYTRSDANYMGAPGYLVLGGATITDDIEYIGPVLTSPDLRFDVEDVAGNLDVIGGAALTEVSAGTWAWDGTDLKRQVTYAETTVVGDNLQFRISDMDAGVIIDKMKFDLVRAF